MYIHTGNSRIVFQRELIGIFNYNLFTGHQSGNNLKISEQNLQWPRNSRERSQSIIVTDRAVISSPISPLTLAGRSKNLISGI